MIIGSAPIDKNIVDFFKIANSCPVFAGYGLTEASGASMLNSMHDPTSGHVGGVLVN